MVVLGDTARHAFDLDVGGVLALKIKLLLVLVVADGRRRPHVLHPLLRTVRVDHRVVAVVHAHAWVRPVLPTTALQTPRLLRPNSSHLEIAARLDHLLALGRVGVHLLLLEERVRVEGAGLALGGVGEGALGVLPNLGAVHLLRSDRVAAVGLVKVLVALVLLKHLVE